MKRFMFNKIKIIKFQAKSKSYLNNMNMKRRKDQKDILHFAGSKRVTNKN